MRKKMVLNKRQIIDLSEIQLQSVAGGSDYQTCSDLGSCFWTVQLTCYCSPPLTVGCGLP